MGKMKITYRAPAPAGPAVAVPAVAAPGPAADVEVPAADVEVPPGLVRTGLDKARALLRVYVHSRKVRAAAKALAAALAESREVSSWPGDRLPVGAAMSDQVEKLTRRLKLETEAHNRLEALFRSVDLGRSAAAV